MTAYQYKLDGLFSVDAQTVGEELERIYNENGAIEPAVVVEQSRPENAPLHDCFEWNDEKAAQRYRETQARTMIANVIIVGEPEKDSYIRAFVHVENEYQPLYVVLESRDKSQELLQNAMRELRIFESKYRELSELIPVFQAIEMVVE